MGARSGAGGRRWVDGTAAWAARSSTIDAAGSGGFRSRDMDYLLAASVNRPTTIGSPTHHPINQSTNTGMRVYARLGALLGVLSAAAAFRYDECV